MLRRLKVTIGDDGNHSISECPTLDLADNNLQHFGRALANTEDSSDVVAVVPVIADDQPAWAWVDGCGTEPPRLLVSDGLGTNITPNRD